MRGGIDAKAFLTVGTSEEGEEWHSRSVRWAAEGILVLRGQCEKAYMSPEFPPSAIFLQSSFHSQQQAEHILNTSKYFHALKMATLAFKPYTYVPTASRSKSATSRRKPASKPISIFDKLQRINPSSTELSMPQSAVADDRGRDDLGIRGTCLRSRYLAGSNCN